MESPATITVSLDLETRRRLSAAAKGTGRSEEDLVREALHYYLDLQESHSKAIGVAMEEPMNGTATHASHEDVMAWMSSWGSDKKQGPPTLS
ncbi:MAG: ribbon-helix-helix protein, CopG family [Acidobacteriota bacterium]|nr:ribbon-helix-helix protein, CopG family [Acidobacteriota bacterium]